MRVWIFQTGEPLPVGGALARPMRAMNLAHALNLSGHDVVIWSSDFSHTEKQHVYGTDTKLRVSDNLEVRLIHTRGYKRNIGLSRLVDHAQMAMRLRHLLKFEDPPDIAFVGFPPIEPAAVMINWLNRFSVPTLLDVKDSWPDVLLRALPEALHGPGRIALAGYYRVARHSFSEATAISSITAEFLDWAIKHSGRPQSHLDAVFPLTSRPLEIPQAESREAAEWWDEFGVLNDGRFRASFVGSLSTAFDFGPIADAARRCDAQFVICGEGSTADSIRALLAGLPNVVMPGWVSPAQAEVLARRSTVALGPYVTHQDFLRSMPNKFYDAMAHGLPFVTTLEGVVGGIIRKYGVGEVYGRQNGSLDAALNVLIQSPSRVTEMQRQARCLYEREFSYDQVYGGLVQHLERMHSERQPRTRPVGGGHSDKETERRRYNNAAEQELSQSSPAELLEGVQGMQGHLHAPYRRWNQHIRDVVGTDAVVLELGCGTGRHTATVARSGARVYALDIAETALKAARLRAPDRIIPICAEMSGIPLNGGTVDIVLAAGALSYDDPSRVDREIRRVLRPGGSLVVVDSLNHNPLYRFNRWVNYKKGNRSLSTIRWMPDQSRIRQLSNGFTHVSVDYFGAFNFLYPITSRILGAERAARFDESLERRIGSGRFAFKFVVRAEGLRKSD